METIAWKRDEKTGKEPNVHALSSSFAVSSSLGTAVSDAARICCFPGLPCSLLLGAKGRSLARSDLFLTEPDTMLCNGRFPPWVRGVGESQQARPQATGTKGFMCSYGLLSGAHRFLPSGFSLLRLEDSRDGGACDENLDLQVLPGFLVATGEGVRPMLVGVASTDH